MSELGRIPVKTRMACPSCQVFIEPQDLPDASGQPFRCPSCRQQLRIPPGFVQTNAEENVAQKLACPACDHDLQVFGDHESGTEIDYCLHCKGIWFDGDELKLLVTNPAMQARFQLPALDGPIGWLPSKPRDCVRCIGQPLERKVLSAVEVDVCRTCKGTWLDSGELERLTEIHHKNSKVTEPESLPREAPLSLSATIWKALTTLFRA